MHAETFLKEFAPLASGPGGVQKLRELVLLLAVRGRLSSTLATDGDIDEFVSAIPHQIKEQIETGYGTKRKEIEYDTTEPPFHIPETWRWLRLDQLASYIQRGKSPTYANGGRIKIISQKCVQWSGFIDTPCRHLDDGAFEKFGPERLIQTGDLLWNSTGTGTIGRVNVFDSSSFGEQQFVADSHVTVVRLAGCDPRYVWCFLASPDIQKSLESDASGSTNQVELSASYVRNTWIPVPPLAEQKRIVAKVDELMALCDTLEARQGEETGLKRAAATSALLHLTEAKTPEETADPWSLLAPRFDELVDDLETVKGLRVTIRIMGVQGKLGTHGQSDEPTAELLDRVGRLPPPARYAKRSTEQIPGSCGLSINMPTLPVPSAWEWVPLIEVAKIESGHTPSRSRPDWWGGEIAWMGLVDARHHDEGIIFDTIQKTNPNGIENSAARVLPAGTVCFSRTASVGYVVIMGKPMATSQDFVNWVPTEAVTSEWLQLVMVAERGSIDRFSKGAVHQTIYYPAWLSMHIALPPLAEQKRIVAKVNELMALCDRLEEQVCDGERLNAELMASLVHSLAEAESHRPVAAEPVGFAGEAPTVVTALEPANRNAHEALETKSARIAPKPTPETQTVPDRATRVDTKFQEAVLVAAIVNAFFDASGEPIGNFRLQKAVYFARRKMGEHVGEMAYLKKAAGPYNPSMKYSGGIAIAKQKNWLREARGRFGFGHVPGPDVDDADQWTAKYSYDDPARWVAEHFRFMKNEKWETLATVDYAIEHLQSHGIEPAAAQVLQYIHADDEWRPKIDKLGLTEMSVATAMLETQALFGAGGGDASA